MISDPLHDKLGVRWHQIKQSYTIPDYMTKVAATDVRIDESDSNFYSCLAAPALNAFPCQTKEATFMSAAYFIDGIDNIQEPFRSNTVHNLYKFATLFGIAKDIDKLAKEKRTRNVKTAESVPDDCYAIEQTVNGQIKRSGLIRTPEEIQTAAKWLLDNRDRLPLPTCTKIASRINKRAEATSTTLDCQDKFDQLLGLGIPSNEVLVSGLRKRAHLYNKKKAGIGDTVNRLADQCVVLPMQPGTEQMYKLASTLDYLDQHAGLTAMRQRGDLPYPEELCYQHTNSLFSKYAESALKLTNGDTYNLDKVASLERKDFEDEFGTSLTDECYDGIHMCKEAAIEILPTLPRPDAEKLAALLNSKKIYPELRSKAASAMTIPSDVYRAVATMH